MTGSTARRFDDQPAVRTATPLLLGLIGPSGVGKTYSALRLATGIQRISGGEIFGIDTESRRMLHYADRFKFRHVPFAAPFGSLDYLAAIEHCVAKGAKTIIIDSMSHEHEGPGGVLEQHATETKRLAKQWNVSEEKAQMAAWSGPKQDRRRMINTILQINANMIFCFRSKEKMKLGGAKPQELGFMPIAGEEFVYEMVLKCLLLPGANGIPTWESPFPGEKMMMKIPEQFKALFEKPRQLDEEIGQQLAQWAAGVEPAKYDVDGAIRAYDAAANQSAFDTLETARSKAWSTLNASQKAKVKTASDVARKRVSQKSDEDALQSIREAGDLESLDQAWNAIVEACGKAVAQISLPVEAAYRDRKEALQG